MPQQNFEVSGRTFRTKQDYMYAQKDAGRIEQIKQRVDFDNVEELEKLLDELDNRTYEFNTLLGDDFIEEVEERIKYLKKNPPPAKKKGRFSNSSKKESKKQPKEKKTSKVSAKSNKEDKSFEEYDSVMQMHILSELKRQERKRKWTIFVLSVLATACMVYVGIYYYQFEKNRVDYDNLAELKEKDSKKEPELGYTLTVEPEKDMPPILAKYETLYKKNKKLIGWLKIDDTNIDYPVMQTVNNEYYLDHNYNQEYDKNGSIFLDKDCNAAFPNTNMIIYGHHMKSGKMFGSLNKYSQKSYFEKHRYIDFDTIYKKGKYEVMYVFRSKVYSEEDVNFKYYQFIDAGSSKEFDSYMNEMAEASLYDTGVTAGYGDELLTLSTCDYQQKKGRFVVVAKRIS